VPAGVAGTSYLEMAEAIGADLTVVGPEAPWWRAGGRVPGARAKDRGTGPERGALEGSKVFAKNFLIQAKYPRRTLRPSKTRPMRARRSTVSAFRCVEADGLAAGKGVIIAHDRTEAETALGKLKAGW